MTGMDLDGCRNPTTGEIDAWAQETLSRIPPTYAEVSPSGAGVKAWFRGTLPTDIRAHKIKLPGEGHGGKIPGIEFYSQGRYFCVTGRKLPGYPSTLADGGDRLASLLREIVAANEATKRKTALAIVASNHEWDGDRRKLVERATAYVAMMEPAIAGQSGHDKLFRVANALVNRFGLNDDETMAVLAEHYNPRCVPEWSEGELAHKMNDARKEPMRLDLRDAPRDGMPSAGRTPVDLSRFMVSGAPPVPAKVDSYSRAARIISARQLQVENPTMRPAIIDGLLREGETGNLISGSKIGKSWLVYYLAICFVTIRLIFGRFATVGGRVLIIDNELHTETLASRLRTVADAMGVKQDEYADLVDVMSLRGNLRNITELAGDLKDIPHGRYKIIFVDAKYRTVGPDSDENSNSDETRFYNEVERLAGQTGAAPVLVHHSTKGQQGDKRATDVGAGGGAQSRAADCHLVLREHEQEGVVVLDAAVRSFKPVEPMALKWAFPLWVPAEEIDPALLKGKKTESEEKQSSQDQETDGKVIDGCQTWRSRAELKKTFGWGDTRLNRSIFRLVEAGFLEAGFEVRRGNETEVFRKTINAR
ncbi:MAG TPA: AAA family ATPase [Planctomycetaceae bacterium]